MESGYMVIAKDGVEYGPIDRDTIQAWYREGRIDRNSRVYRAGGHKFRLHEMFDLTVWNNPALVDEAAAAAADRPGFNPAMLSEVARAQNVRTSGMLAAAIIFLVQAGVELLALIALLTVAGSAQARGSAAFPLGFALVLDVALGIGLLSGNQRFRGWGLGRAALGAVFFGLMAPLVTMTPTGWILASFQLLFCVGIVSLLLSDQPSKGRLIASVAAALVAWSGIITTEFVSGFVAGYKEQQDFQQYAVSGAGFEDDQLGVSVKLPGGWSLLTADNPLVKLPNAAMVAGHMKSGCFAALIVEPVVLDGYSLDSYLDLVVENRRRLSASMVEVGRNDLEFGGNTGKLLETSWTTNGMKFRGFTTACKAGSSYYLLTGWCLEQSYKKAFPEFQSLETAFRITGTGPPQDDPTRPSTPKSKSRTGR